ncbi:MAG TPA: AMP-binding protein [Aliidongia sp.]|nr:AMP-binding protein [Aliidongia sp.]
MLDRSYVHGVSDVALIGETVGAMLDRVAETHGDRPALVERHQGTRWSYAELAQAADRFAVGLLALGLEPGDRIGIWSPNNTEWVVTQFAAAKAGLVLVTINPAYRTAELDYCLNKVGCRALVLAAAFKGSDYLDMLSQLQRDGAVPELRHVVVIGGEASGADRFEDVMERANPGGLDRLRALGRRLQFDDAMNIQFTSGTTGASKGATLSHHNVLNNGFFIGERMRLGPEDRLCIPVPLYHCFGMVLGNLACLTHAAAMIFPGESFDPESVLAAVEAERCTALHGVPTMFIAALDHPDFARFDLSSLRTGIMAGSPCPAEIMRRAVEEMHLGEITIAYGMTETSPVSFQSSTDTPFDLRVGTVGTIMPHTEVKIVDEEGRIVPPGMPGELLTRGYSVMLGYWDDPERTAEAIDAAGWMHTGDLATLDDDGYCRIVGRIKDMIIRGGENIYPREIEEFLYRHPKILDVQVIGVPDPKYGEAVCAWIRLRDGEAMSDEELQAFCRGRIAHYKIPRHIRFVDAFPLTVTGKVQKFLMREAMARELGE